MSCHSVAIEISNLRVEQFTMFPDSDKDFILLPLTHDGRGSAKRQGDRKLRRYFEPRWRMEQISGNLIGHKVHKLRKNDKNYLVLVVTFTDA